MTNFPHPGRSSRGDIQHVMHALPNMPAAMLRKMIVMMIMMSMTTVAKMDAGKNVLPRSCAGPSISQPWCDSSKSFSSRAASLVSQLSLDEKAQLFNVVCMLGYVERLNVKGTHWDNTCIHGVSNSGHNATVFPHAIALGASFDPSLVKSVALATASEMRSISAAKYIQTGGKSFNNVCDGGPLANTAHDPRWGRISETYGEDPYLVQIMGVSAIRGLQNKTDGFLSVPQVVRHFIGYHGAKPDLPKPFMNVSTRDLYDAYLPNYKALIVEGEAEGVMCSYAALNGVPSCQNEKLLHHLLRDEWKSDALVQTDCCDSLFDWVGTYFDTKEDAMVTAVNMGVSLYYGYDPQGTRSLWNTTIADKRLKTSQLDTAAARVLATRFRTGEFDENHPFRALDVPEGVVNSKAHRALARRAAAESIVLLENPGWLPIAKSETNGNVFISGPFAHCTEISTHGGYGDVNCYAHSYSGVPSQVVTPYEALNAAGMFQSVDYLPGSNATATTPQMLGDVTRQLGSKSYDYAVLCLGSGSSIEAEGLDRVVLSLAAAQQELLDAVRSKVNSTTKATKVIILLFSAGGIPLKVLSNEALLDVFYPGQEAGSGILDVLTGAVNPSARLPLTIYDHSYLNQSGLPISNFDVSTGVGRTYRYLKEKPFYRFGFGRSYTQFAYTNVTAASTSNGSVAVNITVTNTGDLAGAEVTQVYVSLHLPPNNSLGHGNHIIVPIASLCAFKKVFLAPGTSAILHLSCNGNALTVVHTDGTRSPARGNATISVGGASPPCEVSKQISL